MQEINQSKRPWTNDDVNFLKTELQKNSRIKYIACELQRSQTAVSKFIARHGLSSRRHAKRCNVNELNKFTTKIKHRTRKNEIYPKITQSEFVNFETILNYLKSKSYIISNEIPISVKSFYPNSHYLLDGQPISKTQMLILANKHRQEECQDVFKCDALLIF